MKNIATILRPARPFPNKIWSSLLVVSLISCTIFSAQSQAPRANAYDDFDQPRNIINYGVLGDGCIVSFDYERVLYHQNKTMLIGKVGWGFNSTFCIIFCHPEDEIDYNGPTLRLTGNSGGPRSFFEYGIGFTHLTGRYHQRPDSGKFPVNLLYPVLGYRFHPWNYNRFSFRVFTDIWPLGYSKEIDILYSPIGFSVGFAF